MPLNILAADNRAPMDFSIPDVQKKKTIGIIPVPHRKRLLTRDRTPDPRQTKFPKPPILPKTFDTRTEGFSCPDDYPHPCWHPCGNFKVSEGSATHRFLRCVAQCHSQDNAGRILRIECCWRTRVPKSCAGDSSGVRVG